MKSIPISLYLDLEEGAVADLEVVARASLAWSNAIKEIAYILDPSIEVRIELKSGTEGSLSLNSIIKTVREIQKTNPKLTMILLTTTTWFALETSSYTYQKVLDHILSDDSPNEIHNLDKDELDSLAREVARRLEEGIAENQKKTIFEELEKDLSIKGAGITGRPRRRPKKIVPRSEFAARAGATTSIDETTERRTKRETIPVTLVSPILKDAERRWRFQTGSLPEFGATMKDHDFLEGVRQGDIEIPLRIGIEMLVELEVKEEFEDGVWVTKERNVMRVIKPSRREAGLFAPQS